MLVVVVEICILTKVGKIVNKHDVRNKIQDNTNVYRNYFCNVQLFPRSKSEEKIFDQTSFPVNRISLSQGVSCYTF